MSAGEIESYYHVHCMVISAAEPVEPRALCIGGDTGSRAHVAGKPGSTRLKTPGK